MGILIGLIIRKRWMTITALALTFVGALTLPGLPSPASYTVLVPPVILIMAIIYEGGSLSGLTISSRLRLALTLNPGLLQLAGLYVTRTRRSARSVPINVAAVGDPGDEDEIFGIVHRVDDAVIANADAEVIPTGKLY